MTPEQRAAHDADVAQHNTRRFVLRIIVLPAAFVVMLVAGALRPLWVSMRSACGDILATEDVARILGRLVDDVGLEVDAIEYVCWARFRGPGPASVRPNLLTVVLDRAIGSASDSFNRWLEDRRVDRNVRKLEAVDGLGDEAWYVVAGDFAALHVRLGERGAVELTVWGDAGKAELLELAKLALAHRDVLDAHMAPD